MKDSVKSEKLNYYYLDMEKQLIRPKQNFHKIDKNGVLMFKIPWTTNFEYHPVSILHYALANYQKYLDTKEKKYLKIFLTQSEFLEKKLVVKKEFAVWEHHYKLPYHNFNRIPWIHGMVQGMGLSVFLRAYQNTEEKKYIDASKKILNSFKLDIKDGGIRYIDENKNYWYEEYAILPPPHVLNGFIYALFGVYDYYRVTKDKEAKEIWDKGIKTIVENLEKYDAGYWSYYSLNKKQPTNLSYHKLHVEQLKALYKITKKDIFKKYHEKWKRYLKKQFNRRKAFLLKNLYSIKEHGLIGSLNRYREMKKWEK